MYTYGLSDKDLDMRERLAEAEVIECGERQWRRHERSHEEPGAGTCLLARELLKARHGDLLTLGRSLGCP